ncbi:MORN repeat-containing protein 5-like [Ostrinia nubilalis]|uniref:MORN repeat-containing protein 5-like n=1 Tax=Ostrinia nubilalis TaxID=29057 RepID=UPI0030824BFA
MSKSQGSSVVSEKRVSQWEDLMRKFSEAHREECKSVSVDIPRVPRSVKQFPTGSQYEGTWDVLGMSGYGTYIFPNDVIYEGEFYDGMFHGNGELRYPCGAILRGKWKRGLLTERTLMFADGLEYSDDDWKYCRMPDRSAILRGKGKRGLLTERTLMFADELEYSDDDWKYCRMPDRRLVHFFMRHL